MRILGLLLCLVSAQAQAIGRHAPIEARVVHRLQMEDLEGLAQEALTKALNRAADAFDDRGRPELGQRLRREWTARSALGLMDTGDHEPLSLWIAQWYQILEDVFGADFLELTHLRDIWVLNFTLPVVLAPDEAAPWCQEQLRSHPEDTCDREYRRHFAGTKYGGIDPYATDDLHHGFAGVVTYWLVYGACEAATYGTGQILLCGPAGTAAEDSMEMFLAPAISGNIWTRHN